MLKFKREYGNVNVTPKKRKNLGEKEKSSIERVVWHQALPRRVNLQQRVKMKLGGRKAKERVE